MPDTWCDNVAVLLQETAARDPDALAIAEPLGRDALGQRQYRQITFRELDADSSRIAGGLRDLGARPGMRLALLVRPSIDFVSLVFALFKAGLVVILIDPGMGKKNLVRCLAEARPDGFVAISAAHAVRTLLRHRFRHARLNVTVGRRWFWGGSTLRQLRTTMPRDTSTCPTRPEDPAAIIFTTGSTGPPKGVLYSHGNFLGQARAIQSFYQIEPGEIDLPGFPLFALFNCAMGVSTVIPVMDFTRPAAVDPNNIVEAIGDWSVTQSFGSPALWNVVGRHCEAQQLTLPTLRRVLSAGAPVPPHVIARMRAVIHPEGEIHTPYGATEALPVASIAGRELLEETAAQTALGKGTCVGHRLAGIEWQVIRIRDDAIPDIREVEPLPVGEIGELIVRGPVVTAEYVTRTDANALHKIHDGAGFWHRMGDVGYLDATDRFWFCGRKAHRLQTVHGIMFTIPCEAIFNGHPDVYRSALVGVGAPGAQVPVIVVETWPERRPAAAADQQRLVQELRQLAGQNPLTQSIEHFLVHPSLPVDIRHNAKIFRERLAEWAARHV
jgi:olefin beta-lactone synthetase